MAKKDKKQKKQKKQIVKKPKAETKKKVKKRWFKILASPEFQEVPIGESLLDDIELLKGRCITLNLMNIMNDMSKQNQKVTFLVDSLKNNQGNTQLVKYELMPTYVKKLSKKAKGKVTDTFICETKDNKKVCIKPLIMTKRHASRSQLADVRKKVNEYFVTECKQMSYKDVMLNIVHDRMQKSLRDQLKKVFPTYMSLVRVCKLEK